MERLFKKNDTNSTLDFSKLWKLINAEHGIGRSGNTLAVPVTDDNIVGEFHTMLLVSYSCLLGSRWLVKLARVIPKRSVSQPIM